MIEWWQWWLNDDWIMTMMCGCWLNDDNDERMMTIMIELWQWWLNDDRIMTMMIEWWSNDDNDDWMMIEWWHDYYTVTEHSIIILIPYLFEYKCKFQVSHVHKFLGLTAYYRTFTSLILWYKSLNFLCHS